MLDGLPARRGIRVAERTIFVGMALTRRVRKRVGIHGIEAETQRRGMGLQTLRVLFVPRNVKGDVRRRPCQLVDDSAIIQLVENTARLARAGKTGKAGAAGANAPGRHGDEKLRDLGRDCVDIDIATGQLVAKRLIIVLQRASAFFVFGRDDVGGDFRLGHLFLPGIGPVHASSSRSPPSFRP
ncbi:hypothetical protein D3C80_1417390 [compost metagenome]